MSVVPRASRRITVVGQRRRSLRINAEQFGGLTKEILLRSPGDSIIGFRDLVRRSFALRKIRERACTLGGKRETSLNRL